jgi:hypothetical protein
MTQPQTPPKPKLNKYVSSKPMKKMKMWLKNYITNKSQKYCDWEHSIM